MATGGKARTARAVVVVALCADGEGQCPKPNLRFVHEHDKNDDFLPFLFMNTKEIAL